MVFFTGSRFFSTARSLDVRTREMVKSMKVVSLRAMIKKRGIKKTSRYRKVQLVSVLLDWFAAEPPIIVYTDGSCLNNGKPNARGGIGAYFGHEDSRNLSEPLPSIFPHTNQRAEITAAIRALEVVSTCSIITILTDSKYLVNAMNSWIYAWKCNGFKKVKNVDLFTKLDKRVSLFDIRPEFQYVPAHKGIYGNEMADSFAKSGAYSLPHE